MSTQLRFDFVSQTALSPTARLVAAVLDRTRREHGECWLANKTLAGKIGRSVRTVQLALKELAKAKLIEIARAYWLRSRRRILLLWRRDALPETPSLGAIDCAQPAQDIAPSSALPPDPPIEVPEGPTGEETADAVEPAAVTPPDRSLVREEEHLVSEAESKAVALWGEAPQVRASVREAEASFDGSWVAQAVEECVEHARRAWAVPGLMWSKLRRWQAQGGPPPRAGASPQASSAAAGLVLSADDEALAAKWAAEQRAWEEAGMSLYT